MKHLGQCLTTLRSPLKILRYASYFQLSSRCLEMWSNPGLSCLIYYFSYSFHSNLAIDGNYTEWSEWSECSVTCDGGFRNRTRQCTSPPPQYGGNGCEELGPTNGTQECNTNACRKF